MKTKTGDVMVKSLREDGCFEGYASIFDRIDAHGDVVCKGAFQQSLAEWRQKGVLPKMLWQHAPDQVIGVWTKMIEDDKGLYVEGRLLLDVEKAREAHALLLEKAIDTLSIGFRERRSTRGKFGASSVKFLHDINLMEVSLVTFAANEHAKIMNVKSQFGHINVLCDYIRNL